MGKYTCVIVDFPHVARTVQRMKNSWIYAAITVSTLDAITTWIAIRNGAMEGNPGALWFFGLVGFWTACLIGIVAEAFVGALAQWTPKNRVYRLLPVAGRAVVCCHAGVVFSNLLVIYHLLA